MADDKKKKNKRPTAEKRDIRNEKRRVINKSFKSNVRTSLNNFETAVKTGEKEGVDTKLKALYSVLDKGVKRGVFNRNKAARMKARAMKKVHA